MAGAAWKINQNWSLDMMYRFIEVGDRDHHQDNALFNDVKVDKSYIHNAVVGFRYTF